LDSLPPFPRIPRQYLEPERAVGHINKKKSLMLAHHRKVKKNPKNIITFFSDSAPIQIHTHAYNPVAINFEKNGHKHKWHKLYFTQQQRTDNNGLVFKCCILHKIISRDIKHFTSFRISGKYPDGW
jgi:hypothetical protein